MNQGFDAASNLQQAVRLLQSNRAADALTACREAVRHDPANATAQHLLAVALLQTGYPHQAVEPARRAVELSPRRAEFHAILGRALHALSHIRDALEPFRRAAELSPRAAPAWCDLAAVLHELGEREQALAAYRHALTLEPRHPTARFNFAILLREMGEPQRAIELLRELLRDAPTTQRANTVLAGYLLEAGEVDAAREHCRRALALDPRDLTAISFASIACLRGGEPAEARHWVDLERMVHVESLSLPPPHPSLDELNAALEAHILGHPTLERDRPQNATRNGWHTDDLLRDANPGPMAVLAPLIDDAVARYLDALPRDPGHPYLRERPASWRLQAWAVVMEAQGHQLAHTHPGGWVSGVYYPRVPGHMQGGDGRDPGAIEFGRPLPALLGNASPLVRLLHPSEGTLVLFPSYLYHETVPFEAPSYRISIAFDAIPFWGRARDPHASP